jgi:hypothetical protein
MGSGVIRSSNGVNRVDGLRICEVDEQCDEEAMSGALSGLL